MTSPLHHPAGADWREHKADDTKVREPCCDLWIRAHETGTDNEGYGALISSDGPGYPQTGYYFDEMKAEHGVIRADRLPVRFCPFCGSGKTPR